MFGKTLGHYQITSLASIRSYGHSSFRPNVFPSLKRKSREFISIVSPHIMP